MPSSAPSFVLSRDVPSRPARPHRLRRVATWALPFALACGVVSLASPSVAEAAPAAKPFWQEAAAKPAKRASTLPDFAALAARWSESVVSVRIAGKSVEQGPAELFRRPNGPGGPGGSGGLGGGRGSPLRGIGSGFIVSADGYIVTNAHVLEGADTIDIGFSFSERTVTATVVGKDPRTDVALLKVTPPRPLKPVILGPSESVTVGEWVMAIGNPLGLDQTVTVGIISAKGRQTVGDQPLNPGDVPNFQANFLQTDAAISQGNSGGPLFNARGEVIGVNTAIAVPSQAQGVSFAVPSAILKKVLGPLKAQGRVVRSYLGVLVRPVPLDKADNLPDREPRGAFVSEVVPGSPADLGGIAPGDVIVRFDNDAVVAAADLPWLASMAGVGHTARVQRYREGKLATVTVKLGDLPGESAALTAPLQTVEGAEGQPATGPGRWTGLTAGPVEETRRLELLIDLDLGVLVTGVAAGSPAALGGLVTGDVILKVNGTPVKNPTELGGLLEQVPAGTVVSVYFRRGPQALFAAFKRP
jgi:serine protease Do